MKITEAALGPLLYCFSISLLCSSTETQKKKHLNMIFLKLSAIVYLLAKI